MTILRSPLLFLILLIAGTLRAAAQGTPSIESKLESSMVVVGEQTSLIVWFENIPVIDWPTSPDAAPLALKRVKKQRFQINGRIREGFRFSVSAFESGTFTIPAFESRTASGVVRSVSHTLRVFPVSSLTTQGIKIQGDVAPYLTGVFLKKRNPYLGETLDVEAKLYLSQKPPHRLRLTNGNIIDFAKEGLAAWRFTTPRDPSGYLDYEGQRFAVHTYASSINALREGALTLGPGTANTVLNRTQIARSGLITQSFSAPIQFPSVGLNVRPLPGNAPKDYEGAVGSFTLSVKPLSLTTDIESSLTVESQISGGGNIDQFPGPKLLDPKGQWKQFETVAKPRGSERRSSSGTAVFSHVIRPLEKVAALPPYRFVYFDPLLESYRTLESPSVPITVTGNLSTGPRAVAATPFLQPGNLPLKTFAQPKALVIWGWQIIPALFVLWIMGREAQRRIQARHLSSQPKREFEEQLKRVTTQVDDRASFYREASRFATDHKATSGFDEIFDTRDEICFRPDAPMEKVEPAERKRILTLLRTLSPLLIVSLLFAIQIQKANGYDEDPAKAKLEILAEMEISPSAEHFHNLALCEKKLGQLGKASLWAHRYQAQGGDAEALFDGIPGYRAKKPEGTEWVSIFPKWIYLQIALAGIWALVIMILVAMLIYGKLRVPLLITFSMISFFGLLTGVSGWFLFPSGVSFEPLHKLSVITTSTPIRKQPFDGGGEVREDGIGSLCRIESTRADWAKIVLPGGVSGWVRAETIEPVTR